MKIAAVVTKSRETINFIVFSNTQNFLFFFSKHGVVWSELKLVGKKWAHRACLEDIMQNIAKMGVFFCSFSEGSLGRVLQKLVYIKQISIFPINFTKCQFSCIIFVKEH